MNNSTVVEARNPEGRVAKVSYGSFVAKYESLGWTLVSDEGTKVSEPEDAIADNTEFLIVANDESTETVSHISNNSQED